MADELKTEEEQLEDLRKWWSDYGNSILAGLAIAVLGVFGYFSFQDSKVEDEVEASALYDTLADHVADGKLEEAEVLASQIAADYANTAYVGQSKLAMARMYMDKNRDEDAANALRELLELDGFDELKLVGGLRLSKILLYQGKAEEALDVVSDPKGQAFAARYAEARGDVLVALERYSEARSAYDEAMQQSNAEQTVDVGYIRLKLFDLPPDPVLAEAMAEPEADSEESAEAATVEEAAPEMEEAAADDAPDGEESPE